MNSLKSLLFEDAEPEMVQVSLNWRPTKKGVEWIQRPNGAKSWYLNGEFHRVDGPAVERADGSKQWWLNGKRHREDGPAYEDADGSKEWWLNGELHREDAPAYEDADGTKEWWLKGEKLQHISPETLESILILFEWMPSTSEPLKRNNIQGILEYSQSFPIHKWEAESFVLSVLADSPPRVFVDGELIGPLITGEEKGIVSKILAAAEARFKIPEEEHPFLKEIIFKNLK